MNNTCPNCGKGYNLQPHHVGRRINCKSCAVALVVEADGLHLDPGAATATAPPDVPGGFAEPTGTTAPPPIVAPPMDFEEEPVPRIVRRRTTGPSVSPGDLLGSLGKWFDPALLLFGVGAIFVLAFTIFPVIDGLKVVIRNKEISVGDARTAKKIAELAKQKDTQARIEETREKWTKEKEDLQERVADSDFAAMSWRYWYSWGLLFGFIVLTMASLAFLRSETSQIRRVVGAIVLVALVLVMFFMFAFSRTAF